VSFLEDVGEGHYALTALLTCQRRVKRRGYIKFSEVCGRDVRMSLHSLFGPGWSGWLSSVEGGSSRCRI